MGYKAMEAMGVKVPDLSNCRNLNYAQQAVKFIRNDCEELKFNASIADAERSTGKYQGKSTKKGQIPYNLERDIDRLCLENAIARFVETGSRNDAFDVYYCYCEIFKPFGEGSEAARTLLDLLSEHESNASSLLMKHRDHYSHSVYVFITGLALFKKIPQLRNAYICKYQGYFHPGQTGYHHFLEHWGFTALFHDIGYPFEIAHQQIKSYLLTVRNHISELTEDEEKAVNEKSKLPYDYPYVSFHNFLPFMQREGKDKQYDLCFTKWVKNHLESKYLQGKNYQVNSDWQKLCQKGILKRHVCSNPHYMDHAYFSALMLAKAYVKAHPELDQLDLLPGDRKDSFCAILLHNSLFSKRIIDFFDPKKPISMIDNIPLTYLLMLCDEFQCSDRVSYGHDTRLETYPVSFDFSCEKSSGLIRGAVYQFDPVSRNVPTASKTYRSMQYKDFDEEDQKITPKRCKFIDKIHAIVNVSELFPNYQTDVDKDDNSNILSTKFETRRTDGVIHFSTSSYLKLYNLAVGLHKGYEEIRNNGVEAYYSDFETELSLEYKLSNIGQAKGFADRLHAVRCFYTDRVMDLDPVVHFNKNELRIMAEGEHERWCQEKISMGWVPYYDIANLDRSKRELIRQQPSLTHYSLLPAQYQGYTTNAMTTMLKLLKEMEGLQVYRF